MALKFNAIYSATCFFLRMQEEWQLTRRKKTLRKTAEYGAS
jgi:hypothetical protein